MLTARTLSQVQEASHLKFSTELSFYALCGELQRADCNDDIIKYHVSKIHFLTTAQVFALSHIASLSGKLESVIPIIHINLDKFAAICAHQNPALFAEFVALSPLCTPNDIRRCAYRRLTDEIRKVGDLNVVDSNGDTALHLAVRFNGCGNREEVQCLLAAGANPEIRNNSGKRPIDLCRSESKAWFKA